MKTEAEVLTILEKEEQNALGYMHGDLNKERALAQDYYDRSPRGDEVEGRSQVISSDVADTVEWLLPSLIKIFTSSDKAVEFEPETPKDEDYAKQATQAVNYVFYRQNQGFLVLYSWFKDALIQKNGYVKYWWEKTDRVAKETYQGLTDAQLTLLTQSDEVEIAAHTEYQVQDATGQPVTLHDVQIKVSHKRGQVCIEAVPPEEILVNREHRHLELQSARYVGHRCPKTATELLDMGYPQDKVDQCFEGNTDEDMTLESHARRTLAEELYPTDADVGDKTVRTIWTTEAYVMIDMDGDGKAERRRIVKAGKVIFENEDCERVCISAITPKIRPHRHIGSSVAEDAMEIQDVNTALQRGTLDNLYLTNAPRNAVLSSQSGAPQANLDDLLSVRVGGIVREYVPNAVRPLVIPYVGQYSMQMMEYMDQKRMNRTGVNNLSSGLDADAINKTARGAVLADNQMQQRTELIARVMAETGVKDLFQGILYLLCTYSDRPLVMRLRDEFVEYDPREWDHMMDMTINVGLGTGNKDQQLIHLQSVMEIQEKIIMAGGKDRLVTEKNIYNAFAKLIENAGFKNIEDFVTDPDKAGPPPPPPPSPEQQKLQADMQAKQAELQMKGQENQQNAQHEQNMVAIEVEKTKAMVQLEAYKVNAQIQLQREKQAAELQLKQQMGMVQAAQNEQKQQMDGAREDFKASSSAATENQRATIEASGQSMEQILATMNEGFESLATVLSKPKKLIRGADGRATGVE